MHRPCTGSPRGVLHHTLVLTLAALVSLLVITTSSAASPPDDASEERVRALEERVATLEARIQDLLGALRDAGGADAAELQRRIDLLAAELEKLRMGKAAAGGDPESVHGLGPAASKVYGVQQGLSIGGYGESLYENFSASRDDDLPSGETDQADLLRGILYFGYKFSDRIVFNSEIEFEHASTGAEGEVSLEFAYMDFLLTPAANLRTGLVLVPAGFINELHEPPVFLGATRPRVERVIIPTTWRENGIGLFGDKGPFSYRGYLLAGFDSEGFGSSSVLRSGRQSGSKSKAEDLAVALRVDWTGVPGLLIGGFFYAGDSAQGRKAPASVTVDPNTGEITSVDAVEAFDGGVTLWDVHAEYKGRGLDLRALYAAGTIDDAAAVNDANDLDGADSVGEEFHGWYAQAGYDLLSIWRPRSGQSLTPFVRYEVINTQAEVPDEAPLSLGLNMPFSANPANDQTIATFGVDYKPLFNVSVKLDYSNFNDDAGEGVDRASFAVGYLF